MGSQTTVIRYGGPRPVWF